ncbi:hypothetical protein BH11PSE12_BH11PSE12_29410 [soil metagenome]
MNFLGKIISAIVPAFSAAASGDLPSEASLIDVRSAGEFASGHIDGAISLPLGSIGQTIAGVVPDKASPIIVYCQSGARSSSAKNLLNSLGYQQVFNGGGVGGLALRLGKPVRRG